MSEQLLAQEIDAETGESVIRPFTNEEVEAYEANQAQDAQLKAEAKAKADARTSALAKLAALGLTEEEIAAL
jgi:DNA-binding NarL/FixJ family response regulator